MKYLNVFLILLILSCNGKKGSPENEINHIAMGEGTSVKTTIVKRESFQEQLMANGTIRARNKSELRFKTTEEIDNIFFANGDQIKKGTLIATLNNQIIQTNLEQAKIELTNAEIRLMAEKINFGLAGTPDQEIKKKILKTLYHKSNYPEAKNQFEKTRILYEQSLLKAPFDGTVANLTAKPGNLTGPSEIFCLLYSKNKLDVVFFILEGDLRNLEIGQQIQVRPFTESDLTSKGEITEINPVVNKEGLVRIKARIQNPHPIIIEGMNVRVIVENSIKNITTIPKEALVFRSGKEIVFTVKNGLAQWNDVEIAFENTSHYAIKGGIKPGDTIIISGNLNLTQNSRIREQYSNQDL